MKATILIDNISNCSLNKEWGLSIYIEAEKNILFDFGASNLYISNANSLGIDLKNVDIAALSHAHYDHGNGFPYFLDLNSKSKMYMEKRTNENCYTREKLKLIYEGLPVDSLKKYEDRITYVSGKTELLKDVYLLSHTISHKEVGKKENMLLKENKRYRFDDLLHEQTLVIKTNNGLNIFGPCSHIGASNIIDEVENEFKGEKIYSYIGGFHLYDKSDKYIKDFGNKLLSKNIKNIYTGHCTGDHAYNVLKEILKDNLNKIETGLVIEF